MTGPENERLAVVETKIDGLTQELHFLRADVRLLLAAHDAGKGGLSLFQMAVPWAAVLISGIALVRGF